MSAVPGVSLVPRVPAVPECLLFQNVHDSRSVCGCRVSADTQYLQFLECPQFQSVPSSQSVHGSQSIPCGVQSVLECPRFQECPSFLGVSAVPRVSLSS